MEKELLLLVYQAGTPANPVRCENSHQKPNAAQNSVAPKRELSLNPSEPRTLLSSLYAEELHLLRVVHPKRTENSAAHVVRRGTPPAASKSTENSAA